jgi:hypothetical protein
MITPSCMEQEPTIVEDEPRARAHLPAGPFVLVAALALAWLAASAPGLVDRDSLYHARAGWLLADRGPVREFPSMWGTFLAKRFADKELLFHGWLSFFCARESLMDAGAKLATWLLGTAAFAAVAWSARTRGGRLPGLAALLLLASGNHFLTRACMTRPHLLSIVLALVGARLVVERRRRALVALGFVYAWSYAAPHLLVLLAGGAVLARWPRQGELDFRTPLAAAAGVALGLLVHPQTPNTFGVFYVQNVLVPLQAWGGDAALALGREFEPVTTRSLLDSSTGLVVALALALVSLVATARRPSPRTAAFAGMALVTLGLFLVSARFVEYAAPFAALLATSALDDALGSGFDDPATRRRLAAPLLLLVALLGALGARSVVNATRFVATLPEPPLRGAARWLRANAPKDAVIAHLSWQDFSTLFHEDPDHRYLVGFDPVFLAATDAPAALYLEDVRSGTRPLDPAWFVNRFGARYLVVPRNREVEVGAALVAALPVVFEDAGAVVFDLR